MECMLDCFLRCLACTVRDRIVFCLSVVTWLPRRHQHFTVLAGTGSWLPQPIFEMPLLHSNVGGLHWQQGTFSTGRNGFPCLLLSTLTCMSSCMLIWTCLCSLGKRCTPIADTGLGSVTSPVLHPTRVLDTLHRNSHHHTFFTTAQSSLTPYQLFKSALSFLGPLASSTCLPRGTPWQYQKVHHLAVPNALHKALYCSMGSLRAGRKEIRAFQRTLVDRVTDSPSHALPQPSKRPASFSLPLATFPSRDLMLALPQPHPSVTSHLVPHTHAAAFPLQRRTGLLPECAWSRRATDKQ